jgi:hypothetical protein
VPLPKKIVTFFNLSRLGIKRRTNIRDKLWVGRSMPGFRKTNAHGFRPPKKIFREGGEMMSKKIVYLLFPLMVLMLTAAPAPAATPDHLNFENPIALNSQSRAVDGCPEAIEMLRDAFILAKGPGGGGSDNGGGGSGGSGVSDGGNSGGNSGGNGGSSGSDVSGGGNSDGDCCDNGPQGGLGPAEGEAHQYRHQYQNQYQNEHLYSNSLQKKLKKGYGPGDGDGNDGDGPQDGTGYGAGAIR